MNLAHQPQARAWGCIYHALHALTGDTAWLRHTDDISPLRWRARIAEAGLFTLPYWADVHGTLTTRPFWTNLLTRLRASREPLLLLVTIPGTRPDFTHMVAVAYPPDPAGAVLVSDSAQPAPAAYTLAEFLDSPYAQAVAVETIGTAQTDLYPPEPGAQYLAPDTSGEYLM